MKIVESPSGMAIVISKIVAIGSVTEVPTRFNFIVYTMNSGEPFIFRFKSKENAINKRNEIIDILNED
jgi:hypothetical protein